MHPSLFTKLRLLGLVVCLNLAGCIGLEQTVELNPDLSGRAKVDLSMTNPIGGMLAAMTGDVLKEAPPEARAELDKLTESELARTFAKKVLQDARGVEAWEKVEFHSTPDHKVTFSGVAYFRDLNEFSVTAQAEESGPGNFSGLLRGERTADGKLRIGMPPAPAAPKRKGTPVPAAELAKAVAAMKEQWATMGGMAAMLMKDAHSLHRVRVGGEIETAQSWQRTSGDQAELKLEMSAVITSFSTLMEDEEFLRKTLSENGVDEQGMPVIDESVVNRLMFGTKGNPELLIKPGAPLFDYQAEVTRAQKEQTPELQKLIKEAAEGAEDSPFPF